MYMCACVRLCKVYYTEVQTALHKNYTVLDSDTPAAPQTTVRHTVVSC